LPFHNTFRGEIATRRWHIRRHPRNPKRNLFWAARLCRFHQSVLIVGHEPALALGHDAVPPGLKPGVERADAFNPDVIIEDANRKPDPQQWPAAKE
jgi:hypothetical protein